MRKLNTRDFFKGLRLFKELDIRYELEEMVKQFKELSEGEDSDSKTEKMGMNVMLLIIEKAAEKEVEHKFYDLLSGPLEIEVNEVGELSLFDLIDKALEIANIGEWNAFISRVSDTIEKPTS